MHDNIIIDTSVLIALEKCDLLNILCNIYKTVIVMEAVIAEFGEINLPCMKVENISSPILNLLMNTVNLGKGEAQVIAYALNAKEIPVLLDDLKSRKIAKNMDITVSGTIGLLIKAQKKGLIESAYKRANILKEKGFYISEKLLK